MNPRNCPGISSIFIPISTNNGLCDGPPPTRFTTKVLTKGAKKPRADIWKECTELCYARHGFVDRSNPPSAVNPTHLDGAGITFLFKRYTADVTAGITLVRNHAVELYN